jgi:hypothetical protein
MLMIATVAVVLDEGRDAGRVGRAGSDGFEVGCCTMRSSMSTSPFASSSAWNASQSATARRSGAPGAGLAHGDLGDEHGMPLGEGLELVGIARDELEPLAPRKRSKSRLKSILLWKRCTCAGSS